MMEKDFRLEELFAGYRPQLSDKAEFMASLQRKIEAVEYIRNEQEAQIRHYRRAVWIALLVGLLTGGGLMAALLLLPVTTPTLTLNLPGLAHILTPEIGHLADTLMMSLLQGMVTMAVTHLLMSLPRTENHAMA